MSHHLDAASDIQRHSWVSMRVLNQSTLDQ